MNLELGIYHENQHLKSKTVFLKEGRHILGNKLDSSDDVSLHLDFPTVSRKHAELLITNGNFFLKDLGSKNGTYLGFEKLEPHKIYPWKPSKENAGKLKIGPFTLQVEKIDSKTPVSSEPLLQNKSDTDDLLKKMRYMAENYSTMLSQNSNKAREWLSEQTKQNPHGIQIQERLLREFHENGPLNVFWDDKNCKEIILNGFNEIYIDIGMGLNKISEEFLSAESYQAWVFRTVHASGGRLDLQHPICACTLFNGARFHGVLPPISSKQISVAIRKFGSAPIDEYGALKSGWMDEKALEILKTAVLKKKNILISGGTSTGKTSLLNFLCQYFPEDTRVISVEDTIEISPLIKNFVQLQSRHANAEGKGEISLRDLIKSALRMRPDRIIVGECRGAEVIELLQALNTGHPGSMTTLHANSVGEALHRMELLALLGASNLSLQCIREWIHSSIDLVVQVDRDEQGKRKVFEISKQSGQRFEIVYSR